MVIDQCSAQIQNSKREDNDNDPENSDAARIHWAVTELARNFGSAQGNATAITGRALQQDIADLGVTTIYTVSRVLRGYEQRGILTWKRGRIVLFCHSNKN